MVQEQSLTDKYELLSCIQCGRCSSGCPVALRSPLNIRRLVREVAFDHDLEPVYGRPELWDCTTCSACSLRCPRGLEPHELLVAMRAVLADRGNVPTGIRDALDSTLKNGNPYGQPRDRRAEWAAGLKLKDFSRGDRAEVLYFVGCAASYDPRAREIARALSAVLARAGIDIGILGSEESCCGNEVRHIGEEGLFDILRTANLEVFHKYGIKQVVTTSPHCYNALKNEYRDGGFSVCHYTQFVAGLIESGKLGFSGGVKRVVTYQDPCSLGKQNGIYEEPRFILNSIPGLTFREMDRTRERSLCCEGGGGRMWVEGSGSGERLAEVRVREAVDIGVEVIATACPFCFLTLDDAVTSLGLTGRVMVRDIAQIVAELASRI